MPAAADAHKRLYHLCPRSAWQAAQARGAYNGGRGAGPDAFIHLSTGDQVAGSAALHFAGADDLLLLTVDPDRLGPGLRWEASRGGALFPHLYGDLPLKAVLAVDLLPLGADGRHVFPDLSDGAAGA
ncbi:MAG TPA: DUF952 domain-containing protein [Alphaproteobacteria bacterium]|nr:DUF952 domain-containing protein [Alphaproteobacteria bacterium]